MGDLSEETPGAVPIVVVEWADITGDQSEPGLTRRWTVGWLLGREVISEGLPCVVVAATWDEGGWQDFSTIPEGVVLSLDVIGEDEDT